MRRRKSRDSCDSDAFARPRARRALTGLQGLDARPCPTPPGQSAGSLAGSCAALVTVCCGRKVALFTSLHGGHVVWSNCDFRVLSGPGELYYVPIVCTNTSRRPAELFPDLHESSRSDFGLSGESVSMCQVCRPQWPGRSSAHCPIARRNASRVFWRARVIFDCGESYIYTQQYDILWSMARYPTCATRLRTWI